ncbi:MAG: cbb3-type cytochrome c oxidase N-terminal domain-containing protein [Oligoflexus sp.]
MAEHDKDKEVVRPYVADGIEEYDNPLPPWWVWLFNITIAFGIVYLIWYHVLHKPGLEAELAAEKAAFQKQKAEQAAALAASAGDLLTRLKDPAKVVEGKDLYVTNCVACHGQLGEGTVGPNLTDKFWIHGGEPDQIMAVIQHGVPSKGMVAWEPILGPQKIEAVTAYVLSLKGTNPPNGKAPEGDEY